MSVNYEVLAMLIFDICGILFLTLLFFAYFTKKIKFELKNKLFIIMLISNFVRFITEMVMVLYYGYSSNLTAFHLAIKVNWAAIYIWGIVILLYCYVASDETKDLNTFKDLLKIKIVKIFTILCAVLFVIYLFIPTGYVDFNNFTLTSGIAALYVMAFYSIVLYPNYLFLVISRFSTSRRISKIVLIVSGSIIS